MQRWYYERVCLHGSGLKEDSVLTIHMDGRTDPANAGKIEKEIQVQREKQMHETVVLDLENLEYISRAGLSVILCLRKNEPDLKRISAASDGHGYHCQGAFDKDALDDIHRERELAKRTFILGIPAAIQDDDVNIFKLMF